MTWVRLDDRFPSHRKVALLSDRAFRLHVTALCWCSENLTEGRILAAELRVIVHFRGAKVAANELVERKLWDRIDDGWEIHDFLEYNPDRAKVQNDRERNAARQQALRDRRKAQREVREAAANAANEADSNGVTPPVTYSVSNGAPGPAPVPPLSTREGELAGTRARDAPADGIPAVLQPLADALHHAGLRGIRWSLQGDEAFRIQNLVIHKGIEDMAAAAVAAAGRSRAPVSKVKYFISAWQELPNLPTGPPPGSGIPTLRAVDSTPKSPQQREVDAQFERQMQRAEARKQERLAIEAACQEGIQ